MRARVLTALLLWNLFPAAASAQTINYSCRPCIFPGKTLPGQANVSSSFCDEAEGKAYPLQIDEKRNLLIWRGKQYRIKEQPECAKYGWIAEGHGVTFDFCTATKGYGAINTKDGVKVQCSLR